jgi:hypothetical protein
MTRPADWWVLDLERDPTPGTPSVVRRMARSWSGLADDAEYAETRIRQLLGDEAIGRWIGEAGDAYRARTGDLPGQLGKCKESYRMASQALDWWAGRLEDHQADADAALARGRAARAELEAAEARAHAAASSVDGAANARVLVDRSLEPTPEQLRSARARLASAQRAASSADAAVDAARSRLDAARQMALDAKALRESDGRTTAGRIHEASDAGIPERSRWEKFTEWAGEAWDVIVTVAKVVVAVLGVVALIIGGPLAWVVFAAALVLLADAIMRYQRGEGSMWDIAFAALGAIPGARGLTTLAALRNAFRSGGALAAGAHVLGAGRAAVVQMTRSLRAMGSGSRGGVASGIRRLSSWSGEGLTLAGRDLATVNSFAADAIRFEPGISRTLTNLVSELPTSQLAGFEARLKSFDSLARKAATAIHAENLTASEALGTIKDSIRYTVMTPSDELAAASAQVSERLAAQGFESIAFKNTFGGEGYQGINTTWRDPSTGHSFEVQFHTPESFAAKTETHLLYEEIRLPGTDAGRRTELAREQDQIFDAVPVPSGAPDVARPPGAPTFGGGGYVPDPGVGGYGRMPWKGVGFAGLGVSGGLETKEALSSG